MLNEDFLSCTLNIPPAHSLLTASDKALMSVLVLRDLRAAFDTVDCHLRLLSMEHWSGLEGPTLNWFRFYFSDHLSLSMLIRKPLLLAKFIHKQSESTRFSAPFQFSFQFGWVLHMLPLGRITRMCSVNFNCWWHPIIFLNGVKPNRSAPACLKDINVWIIRYFLQLDSDKTLL